MTKDHDNYNMEEFEEPSLEDFILEEEEDPEVEIRKKKRKSFMVKAITIGISFFLIANIFSIWLNLYSIDSLQFLKKSEELSREEYIRKWKEAVVTIQGSHSKGTGFAVTEDGYILTNHHVIEGMLSIMVIFPSGEMFQADLVEMSPEQDIALLKVDGNDLTYLPLSNRIGELDEKIYVIGNPLMHTQIANEGYILENVDQYHVLKISAPIYKGNSGSPVITESGEVVGVVYAKTVPRLTGNTDSVGLAVPIHQVIESVPTINSILKKE